MNWQYNNPNFEYENTFDDLTWPWSGHKLFTYDLVSNLKPKKIVELGTHYGTSLWSFSQAIKDYSLDTEVFAVDTWKGEPHAGFYGEEVFDTVKKIKATHYPNQKINLVRKTFDEALLEFQNDSIDLLHIDGLHTYEAVKNDFESWLPKVKSDGIVLFHDICVTRGDFGVYKLWEELKKKYKTLEFHHSYGLGVLFLNEEKYNQVKENLEEIIRYYSYTFEDIKNGKILSELEKRDEIIKEEIEKNSESNQTKNKKEEMIRKKNQELKNLNKIIQQKDQEIESLDQLSQQKDQEIKELNQDLYNIRTSLRWKIPNYFYKLYKKRIKPLIPRCIFKFIHPVFVVIEEIRKNKSHHIKSNKQTNPYTKEIENIKIRSIGKLSFKKETDPEVSIIILGWNKWQYSYNCFKSIAKNVKNVSYEVIFINNKSTDKTHKMVEKVHGLIYIKNKQNLGFVKGCNQGVKVAKGKYLVFLNNDTYVKNDWLESLVQTFKDHKNIGLAGSKLIYPDGRLQEAGGIIWKNKTAWNYGKFMDPESSEYNYFKDVDYCSGASIIIPKEIFNQLGGFDEIYSPGYFEDSDLAFRVRQLGYRTVYQPKSEVYHFEGISSGTDLKSGMKKYQEINKDTFFDRWEETLQKENYNDSEGPFLARDRSKNKKTVLIIDHYVPTFDKDAGSKSVFQYIKLLCELGYNVKFLGDNFHRSEPYTSILQQMGVEVFYGEHLASNFDNWLKENGKYIDFVFLSRPNIFPKYIDIVKKYTNAKVIYYGHDLHFLRVKREYELTKDRRLLEESEEWKKIEFEIIKNADVSLYPSAIEKNTLEKIDELKERCRVDILNAFAYDDNIFDYKSKTRKDILFVGGFNHTPNVDAIVWFCKDILPNVLRKNPKIKLYIVGSNAPTEVFGLESDNIIVKGFVSTDELNELYGKVRLTIAPLRFGAGIKGKIIESLYNCVPVITTPCGAEGIDEKSLIIANDPKVFGKKLALSYDNYDFLDNLSQYGKDFVNENYSINSMIKKIKKYF